MRIKTIIVLLMIISTSIFFAGCIGDDDEPVIEETIPVIDETPEEVEEIPVEEEETDVVEELPAVDPQTYTIRMEYFLVRPEILEINKSDTVVWRNSQQNPARIFTLVSEDGLWENTNLVYGRTLIYTFNESGTYNYSVLGQEARMSGSIVVN